MSAPGHETDLLHVLAAGTADVVGDAFCRSLVRHVAGALGADVAYIAEHQPEPADRARVVAAWQRGADLPEASTSRLPRTGRRGASPARGGSSCPPAR